MNIYLKLITEICGITKNITMHSGRHTFATTVTLSNDFPLEVVSKMLGHSSITMTKKYARVLDGLVSRQMDKVANKYKSATTSVMKFDVQLN